MLLCTKKPASSWLTRTVDDGPDPAALGVVELHRKPAGAGEPFPLCCERVINELMHCRSVVVDDD